LGSHPFRLQGGMGIVKEWICYSIEREDNFRFVRRASDEAQQLRTEATFKYDSAPAPCGSAESILLLLPLPPFHVLLLACRTPTGSPNAIGRQ
jgi:hypothetical protein